jgi:hypothetical protein
VTRVISHEIVNELVISRRSMKKNQENEQTGNCKIEEWEVVVSRDIHVIEVKKMNNDMPGMWQGPLFYSSGDLNIVVPGISEEAARENAKYIARCIASAEMWGFDL